MMKAMERNKGRKAEIKLKMREKRKTRKGGTGERQTNSTHLCRIKFLKTRRESNRKEEKEEMKGETRDKGKRKEGKRETNPAHPSSNNPESEKKRMMKD